MNVLDFVKKEYNHLPKSHFNEKEVIIVYEMNDDNQGWGNHSYSAYGVDQKGAMFYCFSSGCSCHGSRGMSHVEHIKKFEIEPTEFPNFNSPENIDFDTLARGFSDY